MLGIVGGGLVVAGAWQVYRPLAFVLAGTVLVVVAYLRDRGRA